MAALLHSESRRLYSWWWDSHISPKNSKWLQENLTDMDVKVKAMIKLIEEDADSFARRAEMYYKKRPELMKLVEEFYRAYRSLAERYDHATGALRQAQRTMAEAFPNQIPFALPDDSPSGSSATDGEPHTPEMLPPIRAFLEPDDLQKDAFGQSSHFHGIKRNGAYSEENDGLTSKKGLKQLNDMFASGDGTGHLKFAEGRIRKGLNFQESEHKTDIGSRDIKNHEIGEKEDADEKTRSLQEEISQLSSENQNLKTQAKSQFEHAGKAEIELQRLQESLFKSEAEKEAALLQHRQSLGKISALEMQISRTLEDRRKLNDEILIGVARLDGAEEQCLLLEKENQTLKLEMGALTQKTNEQQQELRLKQDEMEKLKISIQEEHIQHTQAEASLQSLEKLHSQSLEKLRISALEIQSGVEMLKDLELRKCGLEEDIQQVKEVNSNLIKELEQKQGELKELNICIQDERLLSVQAEEALQSLEKLQSQSQEEVRVLKLGIQSRVEMLKDTESRKHGLEEEVRQIKEENEKLKEQNLSSTLMIKNLQDEILSLKETQIKLENELGLHVDGSRALQEEVYCLKKENYDLDQKHRGLMEQMEEVGLKEDSFHISVKGLQDGNLELKETCKKHEDEKVLLLDKLENMEKIAEKIAILEISLSDANVELEGSRENIKTLEESGESLHDRNSALISENGALLFQLETSTQNLEKLSENNTFLENSLSDANVELDGLRGKLKSIEESCQSLYGENSNLQAEKNTLSSQVESIGTNLENLKKSYAELEDKQLHLESEKESTLLLVSELQNLLKLEKQEHETFIMSSQAQLSALENQISLIQEEGRWRDEEFKEEQHKLLDAQIEIFILQRSLCELKERNLSLARECHKHLEASSCAEILISELEHENLEQSKRAESLSVHNKKLREGIQLVLKSLEIDKDYGPSDETEDESHWPHILGKVKEMQNSILDIQDENQNLLLEKSVYITLLKQLGLDVADLKSERSALNQEFKIRMKELFMLQREKHVLLQMSGQLRQDVDAAHLREDRLKAEMEIMDRQLLDSQEAYQKSQYDICKLLYENKSLLKKLSNLKEEINMLEEESTAVLTECTTLSCLSLIFEQFSAERAMDLKMFSNDFGSLHGVNNDLEKKVREMAEKIEVTEAKNMLLKESDIKLEECRSHMMILEDYLNKARNANEELSYQIEQLNHHIETEKNLLIQKDLELVEANEKLKATQNENMKLHTNLEGFKMELDEALGVTEEFEKKIFVLMEGNIHKDKEIAHIHEANKMLSTELHNLHKEIGELKTSEEHLTSELTCEAKCYEEEVATLCNDIQISTVNVVIFEEKLFELIGECERLEVNAMVQTKVLQEEITSRNTYIDELNQKLDGLEGEKIVLKTGLSAYLPHVFSLRDSITSLERGTLSLIRHHVSNGQDAQDESLIGIQHEKSHQQLCGDLGNTAPDGVLELQMLQARVEALQKVLVESGSCLKRESFDANAKLGPEEIESEESKPERSSCQEEVQTNKDFIVQIEECEKPAQDQLQQEGVENPKLGVAEIKCEESKDSKPEISSGQEQVQTNKDIIVQLEDGEKPGKDQLKQEGVKNPTDKYALMMKDIQLDHVSSSSPYEVTGDSEKSETDDQMLELWETAERDCNDQMQKAPSMAAEDDIEYHQIEAVEEEKSEYPSSELVAEKELGVDKLEVPQRVREPHQEWNNRILERLSSDTQRLYVLQTSIQELRKKMEKSEKCDHSTSLKYDSMNGQLKEAEEAISELVDVNSKLTAKAGDHSEVEETGSQRRRQVSDRVRKGSEKIGRLELELQKIQYIMLKLEEERENRAKAAQGRSRVLLRDYLYGRRESYMRKKSHFCGCIRPKTNGD